LKEEVLDRTMWRVRFGRVFGSVVRQSTKWMNENNNIKNERHKYSSQAFWHYFRQGFRKKPACPQAIKY
jgi:hypothetical protein